MTPQSATAIKCTNIGKCYKIYDNPNDRLKQALRNGKKQYYREFWALRNISFEVDCGESVSIVGRNGSGKSTLLQLICGTLTSTEGEISTNGRLCALLELGTGFNPEFSGIDNVYLNASLLGLTRKETDDKFDEIAAFADIGEFINMPVKTFSTGMLVRLAFAVQSQVEPDILIVDEALAVGDAMFQAKCYRHLARLREQGVTVVLVTHDSQAAINQCSRSLLIDGGRIISDGNPKEIAYTYFNMLQGNSVNIHPLQRHTDDTHSFRTNKELDDKEDPIADRFNERPGYNKNEYRWGDRLASIVDFRLLANGIPYPSVVISGSDVELCIAVVFSVGTYEPVFGISIKTKDGVILSETNSELLGKDFAFAQSKYRGLKVVKYVFRCNYSSGDYFISIGVNSKRGPELVPHDRRWDSIHFKVESAHNFGGHVDSKIDINIDQSEIPNHAKPHQC